jgi:hypothetical protein
MVAVAGGLRAALFDPAGAQQPKRLWRIGIFNAGSPHPEVVKAQEQLRQELNSLGDVEGQNVVYEVRMIKSSPQKIIAQGTDWRFLNELKKELKA